QHTSVAGRSLPGLPPVRMERVGLLDEDLEGRFAVAGRCRVVLLPQHLQLRVFGQRAQFVGLADTRLFHWERRFSSPVAGGLMRGADRKKPTKKPSVARTVVRPRWVMNIKGPRGTARWRLGA